DELEKMGYDKRQEHVAKLDAQASKRPPIVPQKYSDLSKTTLLVEVKSGTLVDVTFDVSK
ncbi:MAG: hypothetical protein LBU65_13850, partial [Planctomycetaceae bacterium]|nr:hypothetical protein [Planctomycetaceae bacterium]